MNETQWLACTYPEEMLPALGTGVDDRKLLLFACACCRRIETLLRHPASREALAMVERHVDGEGLENGRPSALNGLAHAAELRETAMQAFLEASARRTEVWNSLWVGTPPVPAYLLRVAAEACAAQAVLTEVQAAEEAALAVVSAADRLDAPSIARTAVHARALSRQAMAQRERASRWEEKAEEESERVVSRSRAAVRASQAMHWIERSEEAVENKEPRLLSRWEREERVAQCAILRDVFGHLWHPVHLESRWLRWRGGVVVQMARSIRDEGRFGDLPILADALEDAGCTDTSLLEHCRGGGVHVRGCWLVDALLA
jgi:hypothetical protein